MFKCAYLVAMALFLAPLAAEAKSFTAANGVVLPAPELNTLTCDRLSDLMTTYMSSQYRNVEIIPRNHPDRPIYDYENRMAEIHFEDCQAGSTHFENVAPAFSMGFK